ncbi:hypothetical protein SAMN05421813_105152 [Daejeonella rubra]|uniref:Uncharacterized protein n=1 Tax=Daejeonella rubra TaxID=990371 RepID=A0A1G9Q7J9_9SPHI|nr:hypothetical protein [Daejeonella rubra]SDM06920.1 hypothetical protein SAMN05421813_105152 [Daejeonella rubra]
MIEFLIAILLGLACNTGNTIGNEDLPSGNNTEYSTLDDGIIGETGGENGQIPPPPQP